MVCTYVCFLKWVAMLSLRELRESSGISLLEIALCVMLCTQKLLPFLRMVRVR